MTTKSAPEEIPLIVILVGSMFSGGSGLAGGGGGGGAGQQEGFGELAWAQQWAVQQTEVPAASARTERKTVAAVPFPDII